MREQEYNDYFRTGAVLIGFSALILVVAFVADRSDITGAVLIVSGIACFVGGLFVLTLSKGEPVDPAYVGILPAAGTINMSRVASDLGLMGDGIYIPQNGNSPSVLQLVPAGGFEGAELKGDFSFATEKGSTGLVMIPQGLPLLEQVRRDAGLVVPSSEPKILTSIREVCSDILDIAESTVAVRSGDSIVVTLERYRLFSGCSAVRAESPKCCTMIGCPVCSLIACMLAEGLGRPCTLSRAEADEKSKRITLIYTFADAS
jgi:hypothetical protein